MLLSLDFFDNNLCTEARQRIAPSRGLILRVHPTSVYTSHRLSHTNCTVGRKVGTEVGVNSCLVALIATESVSIAFSWLLLPPEVGFNRHGQYFLDLYRNV